MEKYLLIALFAPIVGSLFAAIFGDRPKNVITGIVTSALLGISFLASFYLLTYVDETHIVKVELFTWILAGNFTIPFNFIADPVSVIMMVTVTTVSTAVHVYSMGYMANDKGYNRYFSYLSAFVFSMMILVMSNNFLGLFIGWEGVGLCSWLLIGHWYHKHSASWAANEAFIMNRVADLGMLVGLFILFWNIGSLEYDVVFENIGSLDNDTVTLAAIFLFVGAMGKSAQFPLHTWLADAMEGPTPVSALIHAATMVTAGVYLVIRANEIFALVPDVGFFIACLGAFVAMFAASMALVNNDLKRIIAYSTLSQLGYMFVAAGLGAYWIALFHLMTHAFFKSVLFLGAGNVMHAMDDELNIKKMGGLNSSMKYTGLIMILASLALSGIFPFAGFFSKDAILEVAFAEHAYILWAMLWVSAGLTAFYSFRLVMLVFFGKKEHKKFGFNPHETYTFVLLAMTPLAILAIVSGFFGGAFESYVTQILPHYDNHHHISGAAILIAMTLALAIGGIMFAVYKYSNGGFDKKLEQTFIYKLLINQYYIPEAYDRFLVQPFTRASTYAWLNIDNKIVDGTVDLIATTIYKTGDKTRAMQSGNLSKMLRWMVVGLVVLLTLALFYRP